MKFDVKKVTEWKAPDKIDGLDPRIICMPNVVKPLHGCLRGDAEVLTTGGWKRIDSVTTEDMVATWDKDVEKIIWDHPYETIKVFSKQMVRISFKKYKTFGLLVTPDHRLPIRKQTDGRKQINGVRKLVGREWTLADTTAAKINLNTFQHFITAARNGTNCNNELTDLERVYLSIQADGSLRYEKNGEYTYRMSFKKYRKKARFANICWNSGVKFHEHNHGEGSYATKNGYQRFDVTVNKECKNLWNCFDIDNFSQRKAQQFIDEISLWDGSCEETCGILNRRYVTTSLENAKFTQAVAVIAGVTSSFQIRLPDGNKTKTECYIIDFLDRDYRATQSCTKKIEEYDDYAYCINVPTSYFVVRDADSQSVMITGNCAPRTLLGQSTWDRMRRRCYFEADYKCEVCGATVGKDIEKKELHGHELYSTDYVNGISKFERCVSLCAMCHIRCIHTGRAYTMYKKGSPFMTGNMVLEGAEHAFSLVHKWNVEHPDEEPLRLYATWVQFAKDKNIGEDICSLIDKYDIKFYGPTKDQAKWEDWKLIIGEREYPTPYKSEQEWEQKMEELNKKNPTDERNYKDPFTGGVYDEIKKVLKNS